MTIRLFKPTCLVLLGTLTAYSVSVFIGVHQFYGDSDTQYETFATDTPDGRVYVNRSNSPGFTILTVERPARPQLFETPSDEFFPAGLSTATAEPESSWGSDEEAWKTNYYEQFEVRRWSPPWWMPSDQEFGGEEAVQVRAIGYPFAMLRHWTTPGKYGWYNEYSFSKQPRPGFTRPFQQLPELQTDFKTLYFYEYSRSGCSVIINTATVPLIPMPLGLGANTLFYAGGWWLILAVPLRAKRSLQARHRARLGCCRRCEYDLAGIGADQPCPECGLVDEPQAAVSTPASAA